jgi:hypothetical protein
MRIITAAPTAAVAVRAAPVHGSIRVATTSIPTISTTLPVARTAMSAKNRAIDSTSPSIRSMSCPGE